MPYVSGDSQSVPKWMPGGYAVAAVVYEKCACSEVGGAKRSQERHMHLCIHMTEGVCVCVGGRGYLACVRQTLGISTRLPTLIILHLRMNEFPSIDHFSSESSELVCGVVH